MLGLIPAPYRWAAWAVLAVGLLGVGGYIGSRNEATRHADTKADHAKQLGEIAAAARAAAEEAAAVALRVREAEAASAARLAEIDAAHLEALHHARTETRDAVLRDVRAGRVSLRLPVHACAAPDAASAHPAAGTGQRDAAGDIGGGDTRLVAAAGVEQRVAEQIAIAARADATLTACQATLTEYQRLTAEAAQARETGSREPRSGGTTEKTQ